MEGRKMNDKVLENIQIAIVRQAIEDYRELKRRGVAENEKVYDCSINICITEIKKFFKSKWADALTFGNAELIFEKVQLEFQKA